MVLYVHRVRETGSLWCRPDNAVAVVSLSQIDRAPPCVFLYSDGFGVSLLALNSRVWRENAILWKRYLWSVPPHVFWSHGELEATPPHSLTRRCLGPSICFSAHWMAHHILHLCQAIPELNSMDAIRRKQQMVSVLKLCALCRRYRGRRVIP